MKSASGLMPERWHAQMDDYLIDLRWSPDGDLLAALPATGQPRIFSTSGELVVALPEHRGANGSLTWAPDGRTLASVGLDGVLKIHSLESPAAARSRPLPRGWIERSAWNADGSRIAVAIGRDVHIFCPLTLESVGCIEGKTPTVADLVWHPVLPDQLATASSDGIRLWRLGENRPIGSLDNGSAAMLISWSPDGRWVVTGDQSPSVSLYDTRRREPLFIQGFETKVHALAWQTDASPDAPWLAVGGSAVITVWPCFGKKGPRGARPIQLSGHLREATALDFPNRGQHLASGGRDGLVLLWLPHHCDEPACIARRDEEITAVRWSPTGRHFGYATASGHLAMHTLQFRK
jgi:WD40 repeat protein